tara:strand:+ start:357 stop:611 length:255 start_codon:yes stop_codon:yes gene_type:complete
MAIIELDTKKPIEKADEYSYKYVDKITSYHCSNSEVWLGCEVMDEDTLEPVRHYFVFNAFDVLNCGITDKAHIKKNLKKFIDKL